MRLEPTRIEAIFHPRIWGARSLAPFFPEKSNLTEPLGEAWLSATECRIASGPFAGKTLGGAWQEMPQDWRGARMAFVPEFPLLVKLIFPAEMLSIQVHPDDVYAWEHEKTAGGRGKTEMWHVVSAEPDARVLVGLKPGVSKEMFLLSLASHSLENLFETHAVQAGDTFFVPAGTPHTIGPGMVLCEVQEYSDLTYRVYDYGRLDTEGKPRELQLEKALDVIRFAEPEGGKVPRLVLQAAAAERSLLCACRYFASERWEFSSHCNMESHAAQFELLLFLEGTGTIEWPGASSPYRFGECWFIPAGLGRFSLVASEPTSLIRTWVPDLVALRKNVQSQGVSERRLSDTIFN